MPKKGNKFSCNKCAATDNDHMVMCDKCDSWYHYGCVGVEDAIADVSWTCGGCSGNAVADEDCSLPAPSKLPASSIATAKTSSPITLPANCHAALCTETESMSSITMLARNENGKHASTCNINANQVHAPSASNHQHNASGEFTEHQSVKQPMNSDRHQLPSCSQSVKQTMYSDRHQLPSCSQSVKQPMYSDRHQLPFYSNVNKHLFEDVSQPDAVSYPSQPHQLSQPAINPNAGPKINNQAHACDSEPTHQSTSSAACDHVQGQRPAPLVNTYSNQVSNEFNYESQINQVHNTFKTPNSQQYGPTPSQLAARHVIPKNLPNFDGNPEEWPLFISTFENSTNLAGYSDAENLIVYKRALREELVKW